MPSFAEADNPRHALYVRQSPDGAWISTAAMGLEFITKASLRACDYGKEITYIAYRFSDGTIWDSHLGWYADEVIKPLELLPPDKRLTVFDEAKDIIYGDREQTYGHPAKNLLHIADQWSLYLAQKYQMPFSLTPADVCWMMADLKKAREMNAPKHDNLVDAIGYIGLVSRITEPS